MLDEKREQEKLDLLIEVTKANIEVTKYFTEVNVNQNNILKELHKNVLILLDFINKDDYGLSKKVKESEKIFYSILKENFNSFFWKFVGILTIISAIISALYFMLAFPSINESNKEMKNLIREIQNERNIEKHNYDEKLKKFEEELNRIKNKTNN